MQSGNKKILIIRTGAIGDVVHTTNLVHSVKKTYPNTIIHYLTSDLTAPLIKSDYNIDKILTIDTKFKLFTKYTFNYATQLKKENYDLVINLQPSLKMRGLVLLAGIKKQTIYKKDFKLHAVTNFFRTGLKEFPDIKEEKEMHLYLPQVAVDEAKKLLNNYKRPFIVINAGGVFAKRQGRTYPVEKWLILCNKIQEKYNGTIIFTGSNEDKEILAPLEEVKNSINFIGKLSLENSCGVISQADLMISGDSGPLHIATALGVNSIGLYGSMPINRTGCYCNGINIQSKKACVPCNRRKCKYIKNTKKLYTPCMEEIDVNTIMENISLS